ncbi:MAG: S41 family peptidase [Aureliella sp.]
MIHPSYAKPEHWRCRTHKGLRINLPKVVLQFWLISFFGGAGIDMYVAKADEAEQAAEVLDSGFEMIRFIADEHIEPPAVQQMVLAGIRAMHVSVNSLPPASLAAHISTLHSQEDLSRYTKGVLDELAEGASMSRSELSRRFRIGAMNVVPGGVEIFPAKEARVQEQLNANRYVGVGIALKMGNDFPVIQKVFYGGTGYKAGVRNEDRILKIDGVPTAEKSLAKIVEELRGEEDSVVELELAQPRKASRTISVRRGVTFIPTVEGVREKSPGQWEYFWPESKQRTLVLRVVRIGPSTVHELKKIEASLEGQLVDNIILDLREGGGTMHDVVLFIDQWVDSMKIGGMLTGDGLEDYEAQDGQLFDGIPVVVLVGSNCGADRVFVASALHAAERATIFAPPILREPYVRGTRELTSHEQIIFPTGRLTSPDGKILTTSARIRANEISGMRASAQELDQAIESKLWTTLPVDRKFVTSMAGQDGESPVRSPTWMSMNDDWYRLALSRLRFPTTSGIGLGAR